MSTPSPAKEDQTDRDAEILDELAELGLELARGLQARALAADSPQEASSLATAFQRAARTVRQCLALKCKLAHDAARARREHKRDFDNESSQRIRRRKAMVLMYMHRSIAELTPEDDEELGLARLEDLDDAVLDETFLVGTVHEVIAGLHRAMDLPVPEHLEGLDSAFAQPLAPHAYNSA